MQKTVREYYTEKELDALVEKIKHPLKKMWYYNAIDILKDTYGAPHEILSKRFVNAFIDGYVHAKALEATSAERHAAEALLNEYEEFCRDNYSLEISDRIKQDFLTSKYGKG